MVELEGRLAVSQGGWICVALSMQAVLQLDVAGTLDGVYATKRLPKRCQQCHSFVTADLAVQENTFEMNVSEMQAG